MFKTTDKYISNNQQLRIPYWGAKYLCYAY